jgi:hypothetical protein
MESDGGNGDVYVRRIDWWVSSGKKAVVVEESQECGNRRKRGRGEA